MQAKNQANEAKIETRSDSPARQLIDIVNDKGGVKAAKAAYIEAMLAEWRLKRKAYGETYKPEPGMSMSIMEAMSALTRPAQTDVEKGERAAIDAAQDKTQAAAQRFGEVVKTEVEALGDPEAQSKSPALKSAVVGYGMAYPGFISEKLLEVRIAQEPLLEALTQYDPKQFAEEKEKLAAEMAKLEAEEGKRWTRSQHILAKANADGPENPALMASLRPEVDRLAKNYERDIAALAKAYTEETNRATTLDAAFRQSAEGKKLLAAGNEEAFATARKRFFAADPQLNALKREAEGEELLLQSKLELANPDMDENKLGLILKELKFKALAESIERGRPEKPKAVAPQAHNLPEDVKQLAMDAMRSDGNQVSDTLALPARMATRLKSVT